MNKTVATRKNGALSKVKTSIYAEEDVSLQPVSKIESIDEYGRRLDEIIVKQRYQQIKVHSYQ